MGFKYRLLLSQVSFTCLLLLSGSVGWAQYSNNPADPANAMRKDTTQNKTNDGKWRNEEARVTYRHLGSARTYVPDTSLHTFHRNNLLQTWYRDQGNLGSPALNLLFTPENRMGPALGYRVFDVYKFFADSLKFYNTNRPYSVFQYQLGSRLEQIAGIMHTQNIKPNWNFAFTYRKINSPGYYKIQRNIGDNASISTNYKSLNKHYELNAGIIYNKQQHDENGGISRISSLDSFPDRRIINTPYENGQYSQTRSPVSNTLRDFTVLLQHQYTLGRTDTTYNADSTQYAVKLVPRFSISHKMQLSSEKHIFKDLAPDSMRYDYLFSHGFVNKGSYYSAGADSVLAQQRWFWIDNKVMLNGFLGKEGNQLRFSAGIGNRFDQFKQMPVAHLIPDSLPNKVYTIGTDKNNIISNYLAGEIIKEAIDTGAWEYGATAQLYVTGEYAGNFLLHARLGKDVSGIWGKFTAGFRQQLNSAPYSYANYGNAYTKLTYTFSKESVTQLYATVHNAKLNLAAGVNNYIIANYIYIDKNELPAQYTIPVNISQAWVRKQFRLGRFFLDNELAYQITPSGAPVNVPVLMARHQFSYERDLFRHALLLSTGIDVRYNTAYHPAGYSALLNKFFYQNTTYIYNTPEASIFLNFRIKRFRAFLMADNLQQFFSRNAILFTGSPSFSSNVPVYVMPDVVMRMGFSWALVN